MTTEAPIEARTRTPRSTKAEREARVTEVYKLLVMRVHRHDILQFVAKKPPGV